MGMRSFIELIAIIEVAVNPIVVGECVDIKRNLTLLTKPCNVEKLLDCIPKNTTHRPRPIKDKNQSMILTVRDNINLLEEVFIPLESVEFRCVKHTSLCSARASILVCRLLHLKLFYQIVDFLLRFLTKCQVIIISIIKTTSSLLSVAFLTIFHNSLVRDNKGLNIKRWHLNIMSFTIFFRSQVFSRLSKCSVSLRLEFTA